MEGIKRDTKFFSTIIKMVERGLVIDCKPVADQAGIKIQAHYILFDCVMFDKFLNKTKNFGVGQTTSAFYNTKELLQSFLTHAKNIKKGLEVKTFVFPHWDMMGKPWQVRVTAHKKGDLFILTFKEER